MKKSIYSLMAAFLLPIAAMAESQSWDFTTLSSADEELLAADETNWAYDSDQSRYNHLTALTDEALTAGGTELAYAYGLRFTASANSNGNIRVAGKRLAMNGTSQVLTIPDLKAGYTVTVSCSTASSSKSRGLYQSNLTSTSGFDTPSTSTLTCTGTVSADGDVTLTTSDGGMYIYSIKVTDPDDSSSSSSGSSNVASNYNSVNYNASYNQAKIVLTTGDILYYNTDEVAIAIDDENSTVTVTGSDFTDEIVGLVSKVSFNKSGSSDAEGDFTNADGIQIITAKGWFESLYATWEPYNNDTDFETYSYNVYVKGGQYTDYTQIDEMLVRGYDGYCRADMVGLKAGDEYAIKIVAVDTDGNEIESSANEATDITVVNYSREDFSHLNYAGVGAYNDDGTLKSGAKVFYVTAETAATISTDVLTGSSKYTTATGLQEIIYYYQKGYDSTPIAFRIIGTITDDDVDYLGSSSEGLQIKGKSAYNEIPITIEGIGEDATIYGFGFLIRNAACVELRNFAIMNFMDDGVSIDTKNSRIWIHNLDIFYGQVGGDSDQAKGDGSIDIKGNSQYITVYNCRFWDSGKSSLCGLSESGPNYITYHHNWYDHSDSRHPRVRTMSVHIYNNYFDGIGKYGVGAAEASSIFVDRNYFRATGRPMMSSLQGTDATGDGTFSDEDGGLIKAYGNVFAEKPSAYSYITYADNSTSFDAYEVDSPTDQVPSSVVTLSGSTCYDNFDTDSSLMYDYTADDADDVPAIITGWYGAGRMNHGDFAYNIDGDYGEYGVISDLKDAIKSYTSSLVKIFGTDSTGTSDGTSNDSDSNSGTGSTDDGTITDDDDSDENTTSDGSTIVTFSDGESSNSTLVYVATGNCSTSKGTATYDDTTYSTCLKMESSTSVTITTSVVYDVTLVFGDSETASFKWDGTKYTGEGSTYTFESLAAGSYALTKANSVNLFAIVFTAVDSTTTE